MAWNLVGYIIRFSTTSPIFLMAGSSNFTFLKRMFIIATLLHLQRLLVYYNSMQCTFMFVIFSCAIIFSSSPLSITHHFYNILCWKCAGQWSFFIRYDNPQFRYLLMSKPCGITIKVNMRFNKAQNSHTVWRTHYYMIKY